MKEKIQKNDLFFRITSAVAAGLLGLAAILSVVNIGMAKKVFGENFALSQKKIFNQIDNEFYSFYSDVSEIIGLVTTNQAMRYYITEKYENGMEERNCILSMKKSIDESIYAEHTDMSLVVIGTTGKSYIHTSSSKFVETPESILKDDISREAVQRPREIISSYRKSGFITIMQDTPVIIFAKAIRDEKSNKLIGIAYLMMKEQEFREMYEYFASEASSLLVFNRDYEILSSSNPKYLEEEGQKEAEEILEKMESQNEKIKSFAEKSGIKSYQIQNMKNTEYKMLGIVDSEIAFSEEYNIILNIIITLIVTAIVGVIIYWIVLKQTRPLYKLTETMEKIDRENLNEYVQIEGTEEVRQLSITYNEMIHKINAYVEEIYFMEEEKRKAEIHALQMQINPHYIYNTLASIKWLVWQGDTGQTTKVIDAFIMLLRNTISNSREFITVEEEIDNLKNYVLINQVRYGNNVEVEYFIAPSCMHCQVPKLILQPFVENAFFHGFPEGRKGRIQIFAKRSDTCLQFEIADDGVGMDEKTLRAVMEKGTKGEHFTGIGVNNVDDRIKMIYGQDYGVEIDSAIEKGTMVVIRIPV